MEPCIHIQHVLLNLQPGGLENGVVNVVNGLDPRRFRSSLCCLQSAGKFANRVCAPDASIQEMGLRGGNNYRLPWRLAQLFRRTQPDIVHTRNPEAFFYGFLGAKLARVPALIHSEHGRTFPDKWHRLWVQRLFTRYTDTVFAVTQQLKRELVREVGLPATRIEVVYNGVDLSRCVPTDRESVRRHLGASVGDIVIGSVGRMVPVKNYPLLLRAVQGLAENTNIIVMLVGDGPELAALMAMARALGLGERVRFLGYRDDVFELLAAMDVFVLPSISEGMSNTLLEAMAAGVPVVASDVGGNPEIVRDEVDGLLFPTADEAALRERLQRVCTAPSLRACLGKAGRERVLDGFSIEAMIARYERLYQRVYAASAVSHAKLYS